MNKVQGVIASYGLQDWWLTAFNDDEREYIDSRYQPMGAPPHTLTQGPATSRTHPAPEFLNGLNTWFRGAEDASIADRIHRKLTDLAREHPVSGPGYYGGRHFTTYVRDVENLKRAGRLDEVEQLLLHLVDAAEAYGRAHDFGTAPWYYEQLAIVYRKQKSYSKEVSILERFAAQEHAPGVKPAQLLERLSKARELAASTSVQ
jgi:hypothetical protein